MKCAEVGKKITENNKNEQLADLILRYIKIYNLSKPQVCDWLIL